MINLNKIIRTTINKKKSFYKVLSFCLLLVTITITLYWQVYDYKFVDLDDSVYVFDNPFISKGFTLENIKAVFKTTYFANWHPLTWISLILDYKLFGIKASGYHLTNVFIHLVNIILLFLLLKWITKETAKSALVALLFAVHPLNVESVAWISERKNVLSALFWISATGAYSYYVKSPTFCRYCLMISLFVAGLMTKPILVVLPLTFLLLDYWPLQRMENTTVFNSKRSIPEPSFQKSQVQKYSLQNILSKKLQLGKLQKSKPHRMCFLLEKTPLFLLSAVSSIITLYAAKQDGAIKSIDIFSWGDRFANAIISYAKYIIKMFYPFNLTCFYPYSKTFLLWQVIGAVIFITGMTAISIIYARRYRYLLVGWFWYLIVLLPVVGIVQVGYQAMADRYAYIPLIGLFIIIVWGGNDLLKRAFYRSKNYIYVSSIAIIITLSALSWHQIKYWENSDVLFMHAMEVTKDNYMAHSGIGKVYMDRGQYEEAKVHFLQAITINPTYSETHNNLGIIYLLQKKYDESINQFQEAVKYRPTNAKAYNNMGIALSMKGNYSEAILRFLDAIRIDPDYKYAKENLSKTLHIQKQIEESKYQ
jgi:tetratricopeptide (TPR) repeat protein